MKNKNRRAEVPASVLKRWWWRRLVFIRFDEETHTTLWRHFVPEYPGYGFSGEWNRWHREDELFAFRYELLRRITSANLPEWPALPSWLYSWISGVLSPKAERSVCGMFHPTAPDGYASLADWVWDLTASDEALCKYFLGQINEERRKRGLPDTGDPFYGIGGKKFPQRDKRRGERSRPVSWMAVETYDLHKHGVRRLTDGERSRLSKARREIAAFEKPFAEALEHARRFTPENKQNIDHGNIYSRFIQENFTKFLASRLPNE